MPKGKYERIEAKERFENKVKVVESGCHEWQSTLHRDGYGKFWFEGKQIQAHRMSYILHNGEVPDKGWVLHRCDNRKCVNPDHLYLGTPKDNTQDMLEKKRNVGNTKYPQESVDTARLMYSKGFTQQNIAGFLGINQTTISKYLRSVLRSKST